ncbi:alpha/beta-hydrolase [Clavulina sp. PMI_390]|nr:alpha/beta-hydrolase [Clavulina sp. PMI_390]
MGRPTGHKDNDDRATKLAERGFSEDATVDTIDAATANRRLAVVLFGIPLLFLALSQGSIWLSKLRAAIFVPPRPTIIEPEFTYEELVPLPLRVFHSSVTEVDLCRGPHGNLTSYSGHIGLIADSDKNPKRSFYWYFQAQEDHENAPVILSFGGGPGTSGMFNGLSGQSPCRIAANGSLEFNPDAWSTKYNLILLDHPIGAGFSYGQHVNNAEDAAVDVYDFLQKFFRLFPHLASNRLVLSGGSYGGIYVPTIATEIQKQNKLVPKGQSISRDGLIRLNLDTLLLSNPLSDVVSHYEWMLYYRCELHDIHNSTTCSNLYKTLPNCLHALDLATSSLPSVENRVAAQHQCFVIDEGEVQNGIVLEDIRRRCVSDDPESSIDCSIPTRRWLGEFFDSEETKTALGVPLSLNWTTLNVAVAEEFMAFGDRVRRRHVLFEPLLAGDMRLLHYIGLQDANCAWPGVLAGLKLIRSPFQAEFIVGADVPWEGHNATVRAVGPGAGNMTFVLVDGAGHFVVEGQTKLVREIIGHFIDNIPFM